MDVPKSVSLVWDLTGDERIRQAVEDSNQDIMVEMEKDIATRVRRNGKQEDRKTGNAVWATFVHEAARPARDDGLPDPQLDIHNLWLNPTEDLEEGRWKAAKVQDLYRDSGYFRSYFESKLSDRLRQLGYTIERRGQSWEIAGIDRSLIAKFSRRNEHIEEVAREKGITDPDPKAQLARQTRAKKSHDLSDAELRRYWASRLTGDEMRALAEVFDRAQTRGREGVPPLVSAEQAVDYAASHLFERRSVVAERKLLAEALRFGVGSVTLEGVRDALKKSDLLAEEKDGRQYFTSRGAWAQEQFLVTYARSGRGTKKPLGRHDWRIRRDWLNKGQRDAVRHLLDNCSPVILVRGAVSVGKTTLLEEAKEHIEANGKKVFAFAPSADASRGTLRKEGFADANTVARLLVEEKLQARLRSQPPLPPKSAKVGGQSCHP